MDVDVRVLGLNEVFGVYTCGGGGTDGVWRVECSQVDTMQMPIWSRECMATAVHTLSPIGHLARTSAQRSALQVGGPCAPVHDEACASPCLPLWYSRRADAQSWRQRAL